MSDSRPAIRTGGSGWSTRSSLRAIPTVWQKIYELVINNDPCYAYLMNEQPLTDQKLVMAHVYGHCDFFKNNLWFSRTNRKMVDQMANHATRIRRYIDRFGYEVVEEFLDSVLVSGESDRSTLSLHQERGRTRT